jgi:hypothetical protein
MSLAAFLGRAEHEEQPLKPKRIALVAIGPQAGPIGLLARDVLGDRIGRAAIDTAGFEFNQVNRLDDPMFLPSILRYGGMDGLWQVAPQQETSKVSGNEEAVKALAHSAESTLANVEYDKMLLVDIHQTPQTRAAAARRLREAQVNNPKNKVLPDLLKAIKNEPDPKTRVAIINAAIGIILHYKLPYPMEMVEALFDHDSNVRWLASDYVGIGGSSPNMYGPPPPEALPLLLKAIRQDDAQVRIGAIQALSYIRVNSEAVLPELKNALHDKLYSVRGNAATVLWRMTKQADLVVPAFAALMGSTEPLNDNSETCMRTLEKGSLWTGIEGYVRDKPDEVTSELIRCLQSRSPEVKLGGRLLCAAFLKGTDPKLAPERKSVQKEIDQLGPGDERFQAQLNEILETAKMMSQKPEGAGSDGQKGAAGQIRED